MSAILAEIANDPGKIRFHHFMIRVSRPEALRIKFLERLAREFEPALALFGNLFRRVHEIKLVFLKRQTSRLLQAKFLKPRLHILEMEIERAEFFQFAFGKMFFHIGVA